jgi:pSer/pThr/pTyr-binding forkhead associated (FHA) protein
MYSGPLKPQSDNAIFDCRVLSRTHAQLRFLNDKFYLKDTGSSNGTFVNGQKLTDTDHEGIFDSIYLMNVKNNFITRPVKPFLAHVFRVVAAREVSKIAL